MVRPSPEHIIIPHSTLCSHASAFVRSLAHKRPETKATYDRALREFLRWVGLEGTFLSTREEVERYKSYLLGTKSPGSVSTYLTSVRLFCGFLVQQGVLAENPVANVGGSKRPVKHSRQSLSTQDVGRLLEVIPSTGEIGLRDSAVVHLMVSCALSEIEIIRANIGDVYREDGATRLRVQGKGREGKDQAVLLTAKAAGALERYLTIRSGARAHEPLFLSAGRRTRGMRMTTRGIRSRVNEYLESAGIKRGRMRTITPFSLRHTAAVLMAEAGATPDEIKQRMRLGTIATAMLYVNQRNRGRHHTHYQETPTP